MKIISETFRSGWVPIFGQQRVYVTLTVEVDFGDGKVWLAMSRVLLPVDAPEVILPETTAKLRARIQGITVQEVAARLFEKWCLSTQTAFI